MGIACTNDLAGAPEAVRRHMAGAKGRWVVATATGASSHEDRASAVAALLACRGFAWLVDLGPQAVAA